MSQVQEVVRCYSCQTFQAHIQKKVKKWICKICQEKQSVLKVYFTGLGAECRRIVMDLNMQRGELQETKGEMLLSRLDNGTESTQEIKHEPQEDGEGSLSTIKPETQNYRTGNGSKWSAYLDPEEESKREKICSEDEEHEEDLEKENFTDSYLEQKNWNQLEEQTDLLSVPEKPNSIFHSTKKTNSFQVKKSETYIQPSRSSVGREARWEEAAVDTREEHHTEEPQKLDDKSSAKLKCPPSKKTKWSAFLQEPVVADSSDAASSLNEISCSSNLSLNHPKSSSHLETAGSVGRGQIGVNPLNIKAPKFIGMRKSAPHPNVLKPLIESERNAPVNINIAVSSFSSSEQTPSSSKVSIATTDFTKRFLLHRS